MLILIIIILLTTITILVIILMLLLIMILTLILILVLILIILTNIINIINNTTTNINNTNNINIIIITIITNIINITSAAAPATKSLPGSVKPSELGLGQHNSCCLHLDLDLLNGVWPVRLRPCPGCPCAPVSFFNKTLKALIWFCLSLINLLTLLKALISKQKKAMLLLP